MATLSLLPISTSAATSAVVTYTASDGGAFMLSYDPANASGITRVSATVERKTSGGLWIPVGTVGGNGRDYAVSVEGDYRVVTAGSTVPFGVDNIGKPA